MPKPDAIYATRAPSTYAVGEDVFVHAMGSLYGGKVCKVTDKTVSVTYTSGAGVPRKITFNPRVEYCGALRAERGRNFRGPRAVPLSEVFE